ncbi:MAG TPA: hypothetical protein VMB78_02240 [Dissulfurispiraceae bacterium]|nr:hypothetical protein [Dissulfurispiraceae bacterium]
MVVSLERLYSVAREKNLHEGVSYITTGDRHIIEARLYNDILINLRSSALSRDQMIDCLLSDDFTEISEVAADVGLEDIQALTIEKTFPACSPFLFSADEKMVQRLLDILMILACLAKAGFEGLTAFGIVCDEITKSFPKFSLSGETIRKRIDEFLNEFLIAYPFVGSEPVPSEYHLVPGWVFDRLKMPPGLFRDIFIYYIFFGDVFESVFRTIVKKEKGFGAKVGHARMSKVIYSAAANSNAVAIFKGASGVGELKLFCHAEKKTGILITQADLDKLGIRDGDTVSLIFKKKSEE